MKNVVDQLVSLFKEWEKYSQKEWGWSTQTYCNGNVWCYFSTEGTDHTSVEIEKVAIGFHATPQN